MNASFRQHFPSLFRLINDQPVVYLDGPAGTQVPNSVIHAIVDYYRHSNANTHGTFAASVETDRVMEKTRSSVAAFLNAPGSGNISFGQNMTTLNYSLCRAIGRILQAGDEVLITQLDHEANRGPWLSLRENGIIVKEIVLKNDGTLDYEDFYNKLSDRTRLVAMGYASNIFGTVNDIAFAREITLKVGAWLLIDAVHYAPHFSIDVLENGCDFLLCSAYKFYGPHVGILYSKTGLLDRLQPDRLRTTDQMAPFSIETGTLNHAAIAGVNAAIEFIANLGSGDGLREKLVTGMGVISNHESSMVTKLYEGLRQINGIHIAGPDLSAKMRAPTLAVVAEGKSPLEVCRFLSGKNIYAWDGHFYALRATEVTGLWKNGGVTRMGISAYTIPEEIDLALNYMREFMKS